MNPRTVFGLPAFNRPDALPETLESILSQTCGDFALVITDDSTDAATADLVESYRRIDPRIVYTRNPRRIGMVANWRRAFDTARTRFPASEYFAWVSDHDVWHPRWLERLIVELEQYQDVVLVYPGVLRIFEDARPAVNRSFDTFGVVDPGERLRLASLRMMAGNMIYGLFRAAALEQAGVFRRVLMPDRQVLLALAVLGQFKRVPEILWYREIRKYFSLERQRTALFADGAPLYTYVPTHVTHAAIAAWDFAVRGRGGAVVTRAAGVRHAWWQLVWSLQRDVRTVRQAWALRSQASRRPSLASTRPVDTTVEPLDDLRTAGPGR
jgi:glycosyltransferase involved in cell wall biosynthesis